MVTHAEIVVTLDGLAAEPRHPILRADDPVFLRGDGVFETLLVRDRHVCLLDAHLFRLARSAAIIGLPAPELDRWRCAAVTAGTRWPVDGDAVLRLVLGRRRDGGVIGFVAVSELPARVLAARSNGVSAVTLDRGVASDGGAAAPWSVAAAKSVSYAVNAAALSHAQRLGVDDVVLVSTDGFVLEGPRSSVVIVDGHGAIVTPPTTSPILPGTTVQALFDVARMRDQSCAERPLRIADLVAAQGVWLLSSVTLAARVHTLDGRTLRAPPRPDGVAELVDEAVGRAF